MKRIACFASLVVVALVQTSCLKDPIPDPLNSNPFDPGYDGAPLVEITGASTVIHYNQSNQPVDTVMTMHGVVREDLFPNWTTYDLITIDLRNGQQVELLEPGTFSRVLHHVDLGTTYCLDAHLEVVGSSTTTWTICAVANL